MWSNKMPFLPTAYMNGPWGEKGKTGRIGADSPSFVYGMWLLVPLGGMRLGGTGDSSTR